MKSILLSIKPKYVELIASGQKTIEVRKTAPQEVPFKAYIYMTATKERCRFWEYITAYQNSMGDIVDGSQKVIGEFICDKVYMSFVGYMKNEPCYWDILNGSCLTKDEIMNYGKWKTLYGWHISDLKIYDKPRELSEFSRPCSYSGLCFSCKRASFKKDGNLLCNTKITRPPQSWMHVEDLGEEK